MADTDIYRVVSRYFRDNEWSEWRPVYSNRHPHGLHVTHKAARMSVSQHKSARWRTFYRTEFKIQKLGVKTYSRFDGNVEIIYRVEQIWIDVDD